MRRIMVLGMSGAGKSTLARTLAQKLNLPVTHLDNIYHAHGWIPRPEHEVQKDFEVIAATETWVVDGNYFRLTPALRKRADLLIFLDFPRVYCLWQLTKRYLLHKLRLRRRKDLAQGFDEQISLPFYLWVWNWPRTNRPKWIAELANCSHVLILKNRREVSAWLKTL